MLKKNPKTRCVKRCLSKSTDICRCYNAIQVAYADILQARDDVESFTSNMPLQGFECGDYTSDFYVKMTGGTFMVRECVCRKHLTKPLTVRLLDASRDYWLQHGVTNWGIVTDKEAGDAVQG
jgi:hypothetical protein